MEKKSLLFGGILCIRYNSAIKPTFVARRFPYYLLTLSNLVITWPTRARKFTLGPREHDRGRVPAKHKSGKVVLQSPRIYRPGLPAIFGGPAARPTRTDRRITSSTPWPRLDDRRAEGVSNVGDIACSQTRSPITVQVQETPKTPEPQVPRVLVPEESRQART